MRLELHELRSCQLLVGSQASCQLPVGSQAVPFSSPSSPAKGGGPGDRSLHTVAESSQDCAQTDGHWLQAVPLAQEQGNPKVFGDSGERYSPVVNQEDG